MPSIDDEKISIQIDGLIGEAASIEQRMLELRDISQKIEMLTRVLAIPLLIDLLSDIFDSAKQLRAYELSDGIASTRTIGVAVGVDQKTISNWWNVWDNKFGFVEKVGKRGQYRRRYDFDELIIRFQSTSNKVL